MLRQTTKKISASVIAGIIAFLSVAICFLYAGSVSVSALSAFPMKTYIIGTSNIRTYSDTSLSNPIGWIYPTDEVIITKIYKKNGRYVGYGSYPTSRGSKFAFFDLNMITSNSTSLINNLKSESREATGNYTTYRRPGSSLKAGSIDRGDIVFYCNTKDGYVQVLYNIGSVSNPSGMRLAWMKVDNYNRCIGKNTAPSQNISNSRQAFVNKALGEVGNYEWGNNNIKYNTWYWGRTINGSGYAWCDAFVSWCAYYSGVSKSVIPHYALVADTRNFYQKQGRFYKSRYYGGSYTPKKGDLVFYGKNGASHIGIIIDSPKNGYLQTVEGNISIGGGKWSVVKFTANSNRTVNSSYVYGYASPNF